MTVCRHQDPELDSFLSRVEDLDVSRYGPPPLKPGTRRRQKPELKPKPSIDLSDKIESISERSPGLGNKKSVKEVPNRENELSIARQLLNGENKTSLHNNSGILSESKSLNPNYNVSKTRNNSDVKRELVNKKSSPEVGDDFKKESNDWDKLQYQSAYNYDRSFSPKRNHYNLNELKLDLNSEEYDHQQPIGRNDYSDLRMARKLHESIPSRGKPRNTRHDYINIKYNLDVDVLPPPSLPPRGKIGYRSPNAPELPDRKYKLQENLIDIGVTEREEQSKEDDLLVDREKIVDTPVLSSRKKELTNISAVTKTSEKTAGLHESLGIINKLEIPKNSLEGLDISKIPNVACERKDPNLSTSSHLMTGSNMTPKNALIKGQKDDLNNRMKSTTNSKISSLPPSIPPKSSIPVSFLSSLEKNKLTRSNTHDDYTSNIVKNIQIDYVDSMSLKAGSPSTSPVRKPTTPSKITKSDSFITSALKTSLKSQKPLLPDKPKSLQQKYEFNAVNLKSVEKTKPEIPPKKSNVIIPKLRSIKTESNKDKANLVEEEIPIKLNKLQGKIPPVVPSRKPSIPEALLKIEKLNKLNKPTSKKNTDKKESEKNEAFVKKDSLRKTKTAPEIPQRKISMPEALKRAQKLKDDKNLHDIKSPPPKQQNYMDKLDAMMRSRQSMTTQSTINRTSNVFTVTDLIGKSDTHLSNASINSTSHGVMTHPTKGRTKGPRRKLPTSI